MQFESGTPRLPCWRHGHLRVVLCAIYKKPPAGPKRRHNRDAHEWVMGVREEKVLTMGVTRTGASQEPKVPLNRVTPRQHL